MVRRAVVHARNFWRAGHEASFSSVWVIRNAIERPQEALHKEYRACHNNIQVKQQKMKQQQLMMKQHKEEGQL